MHTAKEPDWQALTKKSVSVVPQEVAAWLNDEGSLTQRLRKAYPESFNVQLVDSGLAAVLPTERALLKVMPEAQHLALVRHVMLRDGARPLVCARSLVHEKVRGEVHDLVDRLDRKSLGDFLFKTKGVRKLATEFTAVAVDSSLLQAFSVHYLLNKQLLWARRSLYVYRDSHILVNEVYLAAIFGDVLR